jgi:hypothetical protein
VENSRNIHKKMRDPRIKEESNKNHSLRDFEDYQGVLEKGSTFLI